MIEWLLVIEYFQSLKVNYLLQSLVDQPCHDKIMVVANSSRDAADRDDWRNSTDLWAKTQGEVNRCTNYVDFYNIMKFRVFSRKKEMGRLYL